MRGLLVFTMIARIIASIAPVVFASGLIAVVSASIERRLAKIKRAAIVAVAIIAASVAAIPTTIAPIITILIAVLIISIITITIVVAAIILPLRLCRCARHNADAEQ